MAERTMIRIDEALCGGCPGSRAFRFAADHEAEGQLESSGEPVNGRSRLRHWPVQLHLVAPGAAAFHDADVLLAADCVAYAMADFHQAFLDGRSLVIACPKLDSHQEAYLEKLVAIIDEARARSLTVMIMEVPCCGGLLQLVRAAASRARRKVEVSCVVVGVRGNVIGREVVFPGHTGAPEDANRARCGAASVG